MLSQMNSFFEVLMDNLYGSKFEETPFTVKRFVIRFYTKRVIIYEPHIKKGQDIFNVMVFRNPQNIDEGLYVAGRESQVLAYHDYLRRIISRVENDSKRYSQKPKPGIWDHIHKTELNHDYANKRAKKLLHMVFDMLDYRDKILTKERAGKILMDFILLRQFVTQIPTLKNKKRFYGQVRFINGSNDNDEATV